jgi:predicted Zn-dependent protease
MELLDAALVESPADETELVWVDTQEQAVATHNGELSIEPERQTTLFVRVLERGRLGTLRTGASNPGEIANGIRQAIAQSKARDTVQGLAHFPADEAISADKAELFDSGVAELDPDRARKLLRQQLERKESGRLDWGRTSVLVANSRGLRREVEATNCSLQVRCGKGPGAGRAASSSRTLRGLEAEAVRDRARKRHGEGATAEPPRDKTSVVLAPEATIRLIELLQQIAFSASSYHDGLSFLREHLGVQVFDRRINLRDDGTDSSGLPFPFDFEGTPKRPVDLIVNGTPKTPALDQRQAALLGLPPTGHAVAGNDALAQNIFL